MPVDMSVPNSIIQAFALGAEEKAREKKLQQDKELQEQENEIRRQQIQQQANYQNALIDLNKHFKKVQTLEKLQSIGEDFGRTGIRPPGLEDVNDVVQQKFDPNIGLAPAGFGNRIVDQAGNEFLKVKYPELSEQAFQIPTPETYTKLLERNERAKFAPRAESAAEIAQLRAENQQKLNDARAEMQLNLAQLRGDLTQEGRDKQLEYYRERDKMLESGRNRRAAMRESNSKVDSQARMISTAHDNNDIYKRAVISRQALNFVNSLNVNSKSSADDIGLIYAFAKAMDPSSTVREGEYATVQKYAQSWKDQFKFNANRILNNTEFLTPQARAQLKSTILAKTKAELSGYKEYRNTVENRLKEIGVKDTKNWLGDSPDLSTDVEKKLDTIFGGKK